MIVAEASYEVTDPTVDSQIVQLQASGADVFFNITTPKFAAQAIRKAYDIGWKPVHYLNNVSIVGRLGADAGRARQVGRPDHRAATSRTRPTRSGRTTRRCIEWRAFMKKYYPDGNLHRHVQRLRLHACAQTLVQVLKQCGDDLTRENVMKQAANLKNFDAARCCPASRSTPAPTDFAPIEAVQLRALRRQELGPLRRRDLQRRAVAETEIGGPAIAGPPPRDPAAREGCHPSVARTS